MFGDKTPLAKQQYGLVSKQLVKHIVEKIKKEELSLEEGVRRLAEPCECGIFNPAKAEKILKRLISPPR